MQWTILRSGPHFECADVVYRQKEPGVVPGSLFLYQLCDQRRSVEELRYSNMLLR